MQTDASMHTQITDAPTLTDGQKLELFQAVRAAMDAHLAAEMEACIAASLRLVASRQQAKEQTGKAVATLVAKLNTHPGYQLDPNTGTFTVKAH